MKVAAGTPDHEAAAKVVALTAVAGVEVAYDTVALEVQPTQPEDSAAAATTELEAVLELDAAEELDHASQAVEEEVVYDTGVEELEDEPSQTPHAVLELTELDDVLLTLLEELEVELVETAQTGLVDEALLEVELVVGLVLEELELDVPQAPGAAAAEPARATAMIAAENFILAVWWGLGGLIKSIVV